MSAKKYSYFEQCDRFRRTPQGERDWQEMMANAKPIRFEVLAKHCDAEALLDDGETLEEYVSCNDDTEFFISDIRGHRLMFIQSAGFEFIFTIGGKPIPETPAPTFTSPSP